MRLISWNIQWCRGVDGRVDPQRIIDTARALADFDLLCLQEVARNFPGLDGSRGEDQFTLLAALCPGFEAIEAIGTDVRAPDGSRRQFGNLLLSRYPIAQAFRHRLPWPADPANPSMPRAVAEALVDTTAGTIGVMTTHLEYYSPTQRLAQVRALRGLHAESLARRGDPLRDEHRGGPFEQAAHATSTIVTGDFNFRPTDAEHGELGRSFDDGTPALVDAWTLSHPGQAHPPTLGLHDKAQWPEDGYCSDFVFVSENLASRVLELRVDLDSDASDHQPVVLHLDVAPA